MTSRSGSDRLRLSSSPYRLTNCLSNYSDRMEELQRNFLQKEGCSMTFLEYIKYIRFTCDEELERLQEFLYCVDKNIDDSEDKYYVSLPSSNCPPDKEDVERYLSGRDYKTDFAVMDGDDQDKKDELYEELRQLILYS